MNIALERLFRSWVESATLKEVVYSPSLRFSSSSRPLLFLLFLLLLILFHRLGIGEKVERLYRDMKVYAIGGGSEEILTDFGVRQAMRFGEINAKL